MSNFFKDKRIVVTGGAGFLGRIGSNQWLMKKDL